MPWPEAAPGPSARRNGLSEASFRRLSERILRLSGIAIGAHKRALLETRLQQRLKVLGLPNLDAYVEALDSGSLQPTEETLLVESITTHKTDFFREPKHFDILEAHLRGEARAGRPRPHLWSAACSSGPEPYSIAIVAEDLVREGVLDGHMVLATDISRRVLKDAQRGIYPESVLSPVSVTRRKRYFLRSKDPSRKLVRVSRQLRERASFRQLNLVDGDCNSVSRGFSVIFCRNVLIYFETPVQRQVVRRLLTHLRPGGLLFLGHAESSAAAGLPAESVAPTVYRAPGGRS